MKVINCGQAEGHRWDAFLLAHAKASFYHLFDWKTVIESSFRHETYYLAAIEDNQFLAVLPLVKLQSVFFGKIICSMPFINYGGILSINQESEAALLDEAKKLVASEGFDYLELRNREKLTPALPTSEHKVSMTIRLSRDPEDIWNSFKSKQRTAIRRSYKNGLTVKHGHIDMLDDFYTILAISWKNLGTPIYKKSFFTKILSTFPELTRIFIVYQDKRPIAVAFNGYYNKTVEGMWLGSDPEYRKYQASYALYWEMIKHGCEIGYSLFHLGRSSVDSTGEFFKKKWNAQANQLYWQYILGKTDKIPQLNVNNPKYQMAIKVWKKLPLEISTLLGPPIARSIP